jgi:hypothetical protein
MEPEERVAFPFPVSEYFKGKKKANGGFFP